MLLKNVKRQTQASATFMMSILTPRDDDEPSSVLSTHDDAVTSISTNSSAILDNDPDPLLTPILPIIQFNVSICPHGNPLTSNSFRRQYHGCRRCYLVGSLVNSIECGNALGSISLISRNTESDLIETRCASKGGITALIAAVGANDVESMGRLVEMNANVEVFDNKGRALIHVACATGSIEAVQEIFYNQKFWHKKYSDVGALLKESKSSSSTTAPANSKKNDESKNVQRIKPIMMRDKRDRTPLRWAMRGNHCEVVAWLLDHGAKLESDLMEWMDDHKNEMEKIKARK